MKKKVKKATSETAIPPSSMQQFIKELTKPKPVDAKSLGKEDDAIARMYHYAGWKSLEEWIERRAYEVENMGKVDGFDLSAVEDAQLYGVRCLLRDLMGWAYRSVINEVETRGKVAAERKAEKIKEDKEK